MMYAPPWIHNITASRELLVALPGTYTFSRRQSSLISESLLGGVPGRLGCGQILSVLFACSVEVHFSGGTGYSKRSALANGMPRKVITVLFVDSDITDPLTGPWVVLTIAEGIEHLQQRQSNSTPSDHRENIDAVIVTDRWTLPCSELTYKSN